MLQVATELQFPRGIDLPDSDDTPVDNENQNFIPNYLLFLLGQIWQERNDWYLGVDMGVYYPTAIDPKVAVVPDGFLSLGVPRRRPSGPRLNYTIWEENNVTPQFMLEVVSKTYGNEYDRTFKKPKNPKPGEEHLQKTLPGKFGIYETMGALYYVIYNPEFWQRDGHQPFEIYKLVGGRYQLQTGEPYWMPEIGLALGRCQVSIGGLDLEVLSWFDEGGKRHLFSEEVAELERQGRAWERQLREQAEARARLERQQREEAEARAERERQQREQVEADKKALLEKLERMRAAGIDPDEF